MKQASLLYGAAALLLGGGTAFFLFWRRKAPQGHPALLPPVGLTGPTAPVPKPWSISSAGLDFIAEKEGFRSDPYEDAAGFCTVGIGNLLRKGPCLPTDVPVTYEEALAELRRDSASAVKAVQDYVTVPLGQEQIDALTSWTYNFGSGALKKSTLLKRLNKGDYRAVPDEMMKWVKAGGQTLSGLVDRRREEGALFSSSLA